MNNEEKILAALGRMENNIAELKGDMAEVKADVAELKGDMAEVKADISEIKHTLDCVDTNVRKMWNHLTGHEDRLEDIEDTLKIM